MIDRELRASANDLVLEVRPRGGSRPVVLLVEHQRSQERQMAARIADYSRRLQRSGREVRGWTPLVVPLLVAQRRWPWSAPLRLADLADCPEAVRDAIGPRALDLVVPCFDLARWTPEALASRPGPPLAGLALALLRGAANGPDGALDVVERLAPRFRALGRGPDGAADLQLLAGYALHTGPDREARRTRLQAALRLGRRDMKTLGDKLLEQGRVEGRVEGRAGLLLEQLEHRFGPLSAARRRQIEAASDAQVGRWARRVLTAERLEDVLPPSRRAVTPRSTRRPRNGS